MTPAGAAILPDLDSSSFVVPPKIEAALRVDPEVWSNFQAFPALYQRVRVCYVREFLGRDAAEYQRRLAILIEKTRANKIFDNWDDSGLARSGE